MDQVNPLGLLFMLGSKLRLTFPSLGSELRMDCQNMLTPLRSKLLLETRIHTGWITIPKEHSLSTQWLFKIVQPRRI